MGPLHSGQVINQRYRLEQRIGGGGMGEVFRATDTQMFDRTVAIKLLRSTLSGDLRKQEQLQHRFQAEIQVSILLGDHPNIIKILDYGTDQDRPFLVMEFLGTPPLTGCSLSRLILKQGSMDPERVVKLGQQICAGLHYAHTFVRDVGSTRIKGVIHRDIKPSNLFVLQDPTLARGRLGETIKILDFGIAKIMSDITISMGTSILGFVGTLKYASPEQLRGKVLDPRSDVYSLGIVLYEMLTGKMPIEPETDSLWAWIEAHNHHPPIHIRQLHLAESIPASLEQVVMTCLEKDPDKRISSMEILSQALEAALYSPQTLTFGRDLTPPISPLFSDPSRSAPPQVSSPASRSQPAPQPDPLSPPQRMDPNDPRSTPNWHEASRSQVNPGSQESSRSQDNPRSNQDSRSQDNTRSNQNSRSQVNTG